MSIITDLPAGLGAAMGTTSEVGGIILSAFILFGVGIVMTLVRKNNQMMTVLVMITAMGALTAVAWLPVWVLIVAIVVVAAMFAGKIREVIT